MTIFKKSAIIGMYRQGNPYGIIAEVFNVHPMAVKKVIYNHLLNL